MPDAGIELWAQLHYNDIILSMIASQITSLMIVYLTIYSGAGQRKHQSSASPAIVGGIHWWQVNSPHKRVVGWKMFPFDDAIMGSPNSLLMAQKNHPNQFWFVISSVQQYSPEGNFNRYAKGVSHHNMTQSKLLSQRPRSKWKLPCHRCIGFQKF